MAKGKKPLVFSCSSHPDLTRAICQQLGVAFQQVITTPFANGNMQVQLPISVRDRDVFVVQTQTEPVDRHIMELLLTVDALQGSSAARVTAVLPSFPYARGDKKDKPRISIAARVVATLLEAVGTKRVLVMDMHSPQIEGFFRPDKTKVDKLSGVPVLAQYLRSLDLTNHVILAADVGEAKDAGRFARLLKIPMAIIDKRRNGDDDKAVAKELIGNVRKKDVIIVDDEIATAGTIMEAVAFAVKKGAKSVMVAATHGVLCGPAIERINGNKHIVSVVVTDTIPQHEHLALCPKLKVLPVGGLFADAIRRINSGDSVSELLNMK